MTQRLDKFFREKKKRADDQTKGVDWNSRRAEWITALRALFESIERMLAKPIKQGSLTISRLPREITESHLGTYEVEELWLTVGDEKVIFSPKGRNVAGAQGRVDVRGESGEATLVLQPGSRWAVITSRYPQLKLARFNSKALEELLQAVMRR